MTARTPVAIHPYRGDGIGDHAGRDRCLDCGLGRDWGAGAKWHDMPAVPEETTQAEARRIGEGGQ